MNELVALNTLSRPGERQFEDRMVGRVFDVNGRLHWVVKVHTGTGLAQVRERLRGGESSETAHDRPPVREYLMPVSEIRLWLMRRQRKR